MDRVCRAKSGCAAAALSLACGAAPAAGAPGVQARPNVILIVVDDLRFDDFHAAGHPFVATPHIDRLAREGARFTDFFATTPLCSPSRASILTGLYTRHHGILDNTDRSPASHALATFPRRLQQAGYETAFVGKWHMGNDPSRRPGFDYWVAMRGQGEANDPWLEEDSRRGPVPGYVTDVLTERAVAFVRRPRTRPFFLMLAHKALHPNLVQHADGSVSNIGEGGFVPAQRHRALYAADPLPRRANYGVPPRDKPALARRIGSLPPLGPATVTPDDTIRDRLRMLAAVDEGLGRLMGELAERGVLDDTAILLIGDNGYFYGEHGLSEERRLAYEESIRLPLLVRYPKRVKAGLTPDALALTIDLAPTILELAGAGPAPSVDGRSLVPFLRGERPEWRSSFVVEYWSDIVFPRVSHMGYDAVRTRRHKYVRYRELSGMDELYDLEADPFELDNLAAAAGRKELRERLRAELDRLLAPAPPAGDPALRSPATPSPAGTTRGEPGGSPPRSW
jgi:N-acetylglucosamine-6-sulfatase